MKSIASYLFFTHLLLSWVSACSDSTQIVAAPPPETKVSKGFTHNGITLEAPPRLVDATPFINMQKLNANWVALVPYGFMIQGSAAVQYNANGQWWGERDEGIIACYQMAALQQMQVMLKPQVWITRGAYTGTFTLQTEADWQLWETTYSNFMLHFAALADSIKIPMLCIGTEWEGVVKERPAFWKKLIENIRSTYKGQLTYAANWDTFKDFPYWAALDYVGIDAYFPISNSSTPSVAAIVEGWKPWYKEMEALHKQVSKPILFTEYGYRSVDSCTAEPWKQGGGLANQQAQSNAFEGLFQTFSKATWFAGGFVWKWHAGLHHDRGSKETSFSPQEKLAETIIGKWYGKE